MQEIFIPVGVEGGEFFHSLVQMYNKHIINSNIASSTELSFPKSLPLCTYW